MGKKGHNIVYGAGKSRKTQLLISMLDTRISHKVTKIALCGQGSKVKKDCSFEAYVFCNSNSF